LHYIVAILSTGYFYDYLFLKEEIISTLPGCKRYSLKFIKNFLKTHKNFFVAFMFFYKEVFVVWRAFNQDKMIIAKPQNVMDDRKSILQLNIYMLYMYLDNINLTVYKSIYIIIIIF